MSNGLWIDQHGLVALRVYPFKYKLLSNDAGRLAELSLYNAALSAQGVQQLFQQGIAGVANISQIGEGPIHLLLTPGTTHPASLHVCPPHSRGNSQRHLSSC